MNHGSLFSGIGGFDLAAQWMGWNNVFHVEWNPWCRKVLNFHFPESQSYQDVREFDGTAWRGHVDIISGGFPCQPYSSAGKRLGKDDERHLWPEMLRILREAAPRFVVGENVRGLTNWNGGVVFEEVCADLEAAGYEVWTGILPACGIGAPHRRDRIWFVAHAHGGADLRTPGRDAGTGASEGIPERHQVRIPDQSGDVWDVAYGENIRCKTPTQTECDWREHQQHYRDKVWSAFDAVSGGGDAANTERDGLEHGTQSGSITGGERATRERIAGHSAPACWTGFPTQSPVCGGNDGLPRELDGITFSKWRNESIKAYGNAIVPQVALEIFKAIQSTNEQH